MSNFFRQMALSWGAWFAFGPMPDWNNKDEVRAFLLRNTYIITWLVRLVNLTPVDRFSALYLAVLSNNILFDMLFREIQKLWANPDSLIQDFRGGPIDIDNQEYRNTIRDRLRQRIQNRRTPSLPEAAAVEIMEAEAPESFLAVITVAGVVANIASVVIAVRNFRRQR